MFGMRILYYPPPKEIVILSNYKLSCATVQLRNIHIHTSATLTYFHVHSLKFGRILQPLVQRRISRYSRLGSVNVSLGSIGSLSNFGLSATGRISFCKMAISLLVVSLFYSVSIVYCFFLITLPAFLINLSIPLLSCGDTFFFRTSQLYVLKTLDSGCIEHLKQLRTDTERSEVSQALQASVGFL